MACISCSSLHKAHPAIRRVVIRCLPHVLLCTAYFLYLVFGALVFHSIEGVESSQLEDYEEAVSNVRRNLEETILNQTLGIQPAEGAVNWTRLLDEYVDFVMKPDWKSGRLQTVTNDVDWSFSSTMLFCLITITTIGKCRILFPHICRHQSNIIIEHIDVQS